MPILYGRLKGWGWQELWETSCYGSQFANYYSFRNYLCLSKMEEYYKWRAITECRRYVKFRNYKVVWPWLTQEVK